MHEVAKHLAAMGRHGDTTLVHMSPQEVSALHGIAAIRGTHLTHNPHTGLPEAFSLGGFFKSLLPTLAGAAATALTGGALAPVLAGAATGAALNGGNPLMGALTGGLGGFGGMGIGNALGASGAASGAAAGAAGADSLVTPTVSTAMEGGASIPGADAMSSASAIGKTTSFVPETGASNVAASQAPNTFGQMGQGISNLGTSAGRDAFVKSLGGTGPNADLIAAGKVAMPLGMAGLAGIEPPKMEEDKYDPNFRLDLSGDSGLRYYAEGGDVNETPDPGSNPIEDAQEARSYGIGGLSYAEGGDVQNFAGGGYTLRDNSGNIIERGNGGFGAMINAIKNNQGMFGNTNQGLFGNSLNLNSADATPNRFGPMGFFMNRAIAQRPQYNSPFNMFGRSVQQPTQAIPSAGPFGGGSQALFAKGGYLDGPGDGMSDSIPASIEGKQPARLADGEFVVPADVVSHLGNGSTKAGAQRLYSMMDKVRHARTGTTQQGKQINPKKYLPA
jgi:hypothetical protein